MLQLKWKFIEKCNIERELIEKQEIDRSKYLLNINKLRDEMINAPWLILSDSNSNNNKLSDLDNISLYKNTNNKNNKIHLMHSDTDTVNDSGSGDTGDTTDEPSMFWNHNDLQNGQHILQEMISNPNGVLDDVMTPPLIDHSSLSDWDKSDDTSYHTNLMSLLGYNDSSTKCRTETVTKWNINEETTKQLL